MDLGQPRWVFAVTAVVVVLALVFSLAADRSVERENRGALSA
jgi:hypothetical protein